MNMNPNPSELRLSAAREYFSTVKKEMNGGCIDGYIFGSVARGEARDSSDVDLMLVLQRPTKEERHAWNTMEELLKRDCMYNFARNSHHIFQAKEELENKYGFPISVYTHYHDVEPEHISGLHEGAFIPLKDILANAIRLSSEEMQSSSAGLPRIASETSLA